MVIGCIRVKDGWQWADSGVNHGKKQHLSGEILRQFCKGENLTGYVSPLYMF